MWEGGGANEVKGGEVDLGEEELASEGADKQEDKNGEEGEVPLSRSGAPRESERGSERHVRGDWRRGKGEWRIESLEGSGRERRVWSTYVGCTRERETGETRKMRGDTGGKARGKRPDLVDVGIAAGGMVPGIHLCRGVGARDSRTEQGLPCNCPCGVQPWLFVHPWTKQ